MLSMSKLITKSGSTVYQNMLSVLTVSVIWSFLLVPFIFILPFQTAAIYFVFMAFPATMAAFGAIAQKLQNDRTNVVKAYFQSFKQFYVRGLFVGIILAILIVIPVSTWYMYVSTDGGYMMFLFSMVQSYLCAMFLLAQVYTAGLIVMKNQGVVKSMNESIRIFLAKPTYTIGVFLQLLSVCVLLCLTVVGFFLLFVGIFAVFMINSVDNALRVEEKELQPAQA